MTWTSRRGSGADPSVPRIGDPAADTQPLPSLTRARRRRAGWPLLLVLVWAALAAVNIVLFGTGSSTPTAGETARAAVPRTAARAPSPSAGTATTTPAPSESPTPAAQPLSPVSATAYGPAGPDSGDNPGHAFEATDSSTATAWQSDWYRSAAFGNLQTGTGLLIDLGQPVTITGVQLLLGAIPGADLRLLTGNSPDLSQMDLQASANDAGEQIGLTMVKPEAARYLLIWFTLLPPDPAGTFQASVYDVRVVGTP